MLITDLVQIKKFSEQRARENWNFRTIGVIHNCSICSIAFNVFERLKDEVWHDDDIDELEDFS